VNTLRGALTLACFAGALLFAPIAKADPGAWRSPQPGRALVAAVGLPESSLAAGITDSIALTAEWRAGTALGLGLAYRRTLRGGELGWGLDLAAGASVRALRFGPGVSAQLTPALLLRRRWERFYLGFALVAPTDVALVSEPTVRVAPQLELWLGARVSRVWLGFAGASGIALSGGYQPALVVQGTLTAAVPY
jgi:hypothetical protein